MEGTGPSGIIGQLRKPGINEEKRDNCEVDGSRRLL
jgi:hypothetical protein